MTRKQKKMRARILAAAVLLLAAKLLPTIWLPGAIPFLSVSHAAADGTTAFSLSMWALYLAVYFTVGWVVVLRAVTNVNNGQVFDENFLMAVATVGAVGCGELAEGVAVMLFYQVGELFQSVAVDRSRKSISSLMDIRPDYANVEREGRLEQVDPEEVAVGDTIVIKAGERVPLDGTVLDGTSNLDTAALTGESLPRSVKPGDEVISGCVNLSGLLHVKVSKPYGESTVAKILDLVENSAAKKAKAENFITKFARYYTPAVVFAALALAILPPLLGFGAWMDWLQRALTFLVVSCPCALVISIPLSFFGGIGGASRQGILVKGGNYLEALAAAGTVVFDKTGTLTRGNFEVTVIHPQEMDEKELLECAALAERSSDHPIAQSILRACKELPALDRISASEEIAGHGMHVTVDGREIYAGDARPMDKSGVPVTLNCKHEGTIIHVAVDGRYMGHIVISDQIKPEAAQALKALKAAGVERTVMLTGDAQGAAQAVAAQVGVDEVHAQLLPGDKVDQVERLLKEKRPRRTLVFVGDGVNDAPVLSRADIGVAMGAMGSDAAIEAADVVLMDDDLTKLPRAVAIARKTMRIVKENTVFAIGIKFLVLGLAAIGHANMWMAVFADVGVCILAILNAGRMLRAK